MIHGFKFEKGKLELDLLKIAMYTPLNNVLKECELVDSLTIATFKYIYHMADPKSVPKLRGMTAKETNDWCITNSGLPKGYKPSTKVLKAIEYCKSELVIETVEELLDTSIKGLKLTAKMVTRISNNLEQLLENRNWNDDDVTNAENALNELIKITSIIPKRIEIYMSLKTQWDNMQNGVVTMRGGGELLDSYDGIDEDAPANDSRVEELD